MDGKSQDITKQKVEELKALFPDVFAEGKIDIDRLKAALGEDVFVHGEHYELSWAGKTEARKEIQKQTTATLIPDREGSIDFDNAQNVFIEGENLEVLRALQKSYFGKIKMIYIDPPYNTGNDSFVYPDDYTERRDEYNRRTGITNEEGYLNKQDLWKKNSRENGQFHSVWLSMMYPRLYLARNLMREDGVIFVSIDDNEQANLKLLMDDLFGEENFVSNVIWQRTFASKNDAKYFSSEHEHLLVYCKNIQFLTINLLERSEKQDARYSNPDNDPRGVWTSTDLLRMEHRDNSVYEITSPTGKLWKPQPGTSWRHPKEEMLELIANNEITFGADGNSKPRRKRFLKDVKQGIVPQTIWKHEEVGHTQEAKQVLNKIFDGVSLFDTPKPSRLIQRCLQVATNNVDEDLVLDFFGGSGTTAQAVLELNQKDNGNRKFIVVQVSEALDNQSEAGKAGYRNIAEICRTRIRKICEKQQKELKGKIAFNGGDTKLLGFRAFKIAPSNFNVWRNDVTGGDAIIKQLEVFTQSEKQGSEHENMLHELILKSGRQLTVSIEKMQAATSTAYNVDNNALFIFFDKLIQEFTDMCLALQPKKVICLNSSFAKDEDLTNFKLQLKDAGIELTVI